MNLDKGILRIWVIITPIIWIVLITYFTINFSEPYGRKLPWKYNCSELAKETLSFCYFTLKDEPVISTHPAYCTPNKYNNPPFELNPNCENFKLMGFVSYKHCQTLASKGKREIMNIPKWISDSDKVEGCYKFKNKAKQEYILIIFLIIIFPLTFYPIYLVSKRLYKWIKQGFN